MTSVSSVSPLAFVRAWFFVPVALCSVHWAQAAPLDGQLTAAIESFSARPALEIGYDVVNSTVDVFDIRGDLSADVGDYKGNHLRWVVPFNNGWQWDGSLWNRSIDYRQDTIELDSWQVGLQRRIFDQQGALPSTAVRLSAWGSQSVGITKQSMLLNGIEVTGLTVDRPKDRQYQADLVGSWRMGSAWLLDASFGLGKGKTTIEGIRVSSGAKGFSNNRTLSFQDATLDRDGSVSFANVSIANPNSFLVKRVDCGDVVATSDAVSGSCTVNSLNRSVEDVLSLVGFDLDDILALADNIDFDYGQAEYGFDYAQAGVALTWFHNNWRVRGSYVMQRFDRDAGVAATYKSVGTLMGEVAYRVGESSAVFLRGQYMNRGLMGEVPLSYNSITASRFKDAYGYVSAGFVLGF